MSSRVVRIEPASGWVSLRLRELCEYRELLYFLVQRDVTVRYKQTILGASWAVIQPVFTMLIFSVFLGRLAKMPSDGIPYPLFTFAALVPWGFFSNGLNQSANSLVGNSNLITKVHFPRLVIPVATILSGAPDFALAFITLLCLMGHYRVAPTGTSRNPIVVRQYPGERATINGSLTVNGADTWYWGFEVTNLLPGRTSP